MPADVVGCFEAGAAGGGALPNNPFSQPMKPVSDAPAGEPTGVGGAGVVGAGFAAGAFGAPAAEPGPAAGDAPDAVPDAALDDVVYRPPKIFAVSDAVMVKVSDPPALPVDAVAGVTPVRPGTDTRAET